MSFQRIEIRLALASEKIIEGIEVTEPYVMSVGWNGVPGRGLRLHRVRLLLVASKRPIVLPVVSVNHTNRLVYPTFGTT